ncbi:cold-shock protein [Azospirillum canadense]|uniref:cold-shock protein n=1 Tax=Azospirillum canadense TaxID=403962 RepID=UPI00222712F4|nr:cold shock domain-containing protein [Azospirillum canadense]MCW2241771.1 CspA family cold shock protein [Azospirillum canadense]
MSADQTNVTATVKWYKADKGFGFIRLNDGSGEVFLHSRFVTPLGDVTLTEGTVLVCDVSNTPKGLQVSAIHSVEPAAPAAPKPRKSRSPKSAAAEPKQGVLAFGGNDKPQLIETGEAVYGTVRWYNLSSQSGLLDPWNDEDGVGVYFDRTVLRQSGLELLADGEDVRFVAAAGDDGPYAVRVELA